MELITATGKKVETDYFVAHEKPDFLTINVKKMEPNAVNDLFCDPEETCKIEYNGKIYTNYTRFGNISVGLDYVRVTLDKHG